MKGINYVEDISLSFTTKSEGVQDYESLLDYFNKILLDSFGIQAPGMAETGGLGDFGHEKRTQSMVFTYLRSLFLLFSLKMVLFCGST